jgi:hypothetical protein
MILVIRIWFGVKIMYVLHGCTYNWFKHEIFVAEFFTQSKPVWVDDLELGSKLFFDV